MRPLFEGVEPPAGVPIFAWGPFRADPQDDDQPAHVRGRLWRLPSGEEALVLDPRGNWIPGVLLADLDPRRLAVLAALAGAGPRGLALRPTRARVGTRAVPVVTWSGDLAALRRQGAVPLGRATPSLPAG